MKICCGGIKRALALLAAILVFGILTMQTTLADQGDASQAEDAEATETETEEQSGGRGRKSVLADALEAVLGALWLDGGPEAARRAFETWFAGEIAAAVEAGGDDNPKGELQERLQRAGQAAPRYEVVAESGPAHARHFQVDVFAGESQLGTGTGASKREAEMNAARIALAALSADQSNA